MLDSLSKYLKNVKKINLKKFENIINSSVIKPSGELIKYEIKIRDNPAFYSRARIAPKRKLRKIETAKKIKQVSSNECILCNPKEKCARFSSMTGLEEQYLLNDSAVFSNLFTSGKVHGIVVYNYKKHILDPRKLSINNWIDGIKLVQRVGILTEKKYVSSHVNYGPKGAASLEHFHGQFHCEDEPLAKTALAMKLGNKKHWKSWVKSLIEEDLVIDFDNESKTVFFVEWSPVFGKSEFVIMNLENSCFQGMNDNEINAVAKFLDKAIKITMDNISDQFNIINLSASDKDDFCNQFRVFSRAPLNDGTKSWEGYLEFMGETVPHIIPKKIAEIAREY